jgi:NTP pyrophosphatase (non-canonical NTP hydrolase)
MNKRESKKLYKEAIEKWGLSLQFGMLIEECAELIQAVNKVLRKGDSDVDTWHNLAEEMADVEIMIEQLKTVINWQNLEFLVSTAKHNKLLRLKSLLEEKEVTG